MPRDRDDAFRNAEHIRDGAAYPARWAEAAAAFRSDLPPDRRRTGLPYGAHPREVADLFLPGGRPQGLAIIVHGGYWLRFGRQDFSHLAAGAVARGWAAVLPSYPLAPEARLGEITASLARAVTAAATVVPGRIRLAGHSAGGHLVLRQVCADSRLPGRVAGRIDRVLSISGLHDLRPLLPTALGRQLRLDPAEAAAESPALHEPRPGVAVHAWVGAAERPEFVRQTALLATLWAGFDLAVSHTVAPGRHHFDVIAPLAEAGSDLVAAFLGD